MKPQDLTTPRERLEYLATWLEGGARHETVSFDLTTGIRIDSAPMDPNKPATCGTSCCIAGATTQFFMDPDDWVRRFNIEGVTRLFAAKGWFGSKFYEEERELDWAGVEYKAGQLLSLSEDQRIHLFSPQRWYVGDRALSHFNDAAWAARVIRHYLATGVIDWNVTRPEGKGALVPRKTPIRW